MTDLRDLPIWCADGLSSVDLAPVKTAKAELDLDFRVRPVAATAESGRTLAIGSRPPWVTLDYALVTPKTKPAGFARALRWVLTDIEDPKATLVIDTLRSILGAGVRELTPEEIASERAMKIYQSGMTEEEYDARSAARDRRLRPQFS